jgi:hypothetical protein
MSPLNLLFYKMQRTARALRAWSNKLFSGACMELHMANEIIQHLNLAQENKQLSTEEFWLRMGLSVATIERSRRRQASRLVWFKEGDACTRFFHLRANGQAKKNYIPWLRYATIICPELGPTVH